MSKLSKKAILGLAGILVLGGAMFATGQAEACCVYNHTAKTRLSVDIVYMHVDWINLHVDPGDNKCTDGKGGGVQINKVVDNAPDPNICVYEDLSVDNHGWISIYDYETGRYKIVAKDKDGNVEHTWHCTPGE